VANRKSLAETHPEVAREAHGWDPSKVSPSSATRFEWKCESGHIWIARVGNRTHRQSGCPYCSGRNVIPGRNDLATTFPTLSIEAHEWDPSKVSFGSTKKLNWKCPTGHIWTASPNQRTNRGSTCPVCNGKELVAGINDLQTTHPELAAQAYGWDPTRVLKNSRKKLTWICPLGHSWKQIVEVRTRVGTGCPYCKNKSILIGFNDLETLYPEISKEADGWDTSNFLSGSHVKKLWKCKEGHSWKTTISHRTHSKSTCPYFRCSDESAFRRSGRPI
jgi:DNA-directed RNA polymerase subunit RPC12/RpoP